MATTFCIRHCRRFKRSCCFRLGPAIILTLTSLFSLSATSYSAQVEMTWAPPQTYLALGYKVYYGNQSRNYPWVIDAGANIIYTITGLSETQAYYFAVTAYTTNSESVFSEELICYFIKAATTANGQITPGSSTPVGAGSSQAFSIAPDNGYSISDVLIDGVSVGPVSQYTFSNVTAGHTISAAFAQNTYTITSTAGANGTISPSAAVALNYGANQSFTITAATGYKVSDVLIDGVSVGPVSQYTFSNVTAGHTISAAFTQNTYTITSTAGANGTISPSSAVALNHGANQSFTITAATGYKVADVQVDGSSVGALTNYTFSNVSAGHTISATFAQNTYTITPTAGANGTISPSAAVALNYGANQSFTITPATGCTVSGVQVDGKTVGALTSYTFSNVTANHTISASFAQNTYTITSTAGANGTISPSGSLSVPSGASKTFTISPAARYRISNVSVDGRSIGAASSYTFTKVTASHTISATFALSGRVRIQATSQGGGSISPAGTASIPAGTNRSFTITPATGHGLSSVLVDGTPVSAVSAGGPLINGGLMRAAFTYTFANLDSDHSIKAVFSQIPPPVADPGPDQIVKTGSTVTLNGSNSTDTVVGIASYKWTQVSGPRVALSNPFGPICTFTAPDVASGKLLGFKLMVTNNGGVTKSDSCFVNVCRSDDPPIADAGQGQAVSPFTIVTLNGLGSSDADGKISSYKWIQISGPKVRVLGVRNSQGSFVAPNPGPLGASLVFQLQVTDHFGLTTRDRCTVNAVNTDPPPIADAGPNQAALEASTVALDGSGSLDPAGSAVTYRWKQIRGVPVTLSDPSAETPVFTAPPVSDSQSADLLFMLTVTNASGLSASGKCTVTVK
ncbi:MAG: hypothetical protein ABSE08_03480 [Syntrophobacteraceae bacterium]